MCEEQFGTGKAPLGAAALIQVNFGYQIAGNGDWPSFLAQVNGCFISSNELPKPLRLAFEWF